MTRQLARCRCCGGFLEILLLTGGRGGFLLRCSVCDTVDYWAALYQPPPAVTWREKLRQFFDDDRERHGGREW